MNKNKITAVKFLELILKGINPCTGELIPKNSALQDNELLQLIESFLNSDRHAYFFNGSFHYGFNAYKQKLKESPYRCNAYNYWTNEEDIELENLHKTMGLRDLANHFKRQPGAIRARLKKLAIFPQNTFYEKKELIAYCNKCGAEFDIKRQELGYKTCLNCGEKEARKDSLKINEGIAGTREENKKMRGQVWGEMINRSRGRE